MARENPINGESLMTHEKFLTTSNCLFMVFLCRGP